MRNEVVYAYPTTQNVSFAHIARRHIEHMKSYVNVYEANVDALNLSMWADGHTLFVHPVCYPLLNNTHQVELARQKDYRLVGFDVADSDELSEKACELLSRFDVICMPSQFCINVYRWSCRKWGIEATRTLLVPHGVDSYFLTDRRITSPDFRKLLEIKQNRNWQFVLFQLAHSGFRKGADLFTKAMKIVQAERPNAIVLLKTTENVDPYVSMVRSLKHVMIRETLPIDRYVQMFDIADVNVLTTRGGGFEHNALEGVARGVPTIVPHAHCFVEQSEYLITVPVTDERPVVLPSNHIHVGRGWEVDVEKLAGRIIDVLDNIDEYRAKFEEHKRLIHKKYNWHRIVRNMLIALSQYRIL